MPTKIKLSTISHRINPFNGRQKNKASSNLLSKSNQELTNFPFGTATFTTRLNLEWERGSDLLTNHLKYSHDLEIQFSMLIKRITTKMIRSYLGFSHRN